MVFRAAEVSYAAEDLEKQRNSRRRVTWKLGSGHPNSLGEVSTLETQIQIKTKCTVRWLIPLRTVRMGSTKAAVFPEPVGAATRASRPAIRIGKLCICTGVGSLYFRLSIFFSSTPRMWEWLPGLQIDIMQQTQIYEQVKVNKLVPIRHITRKIMGFGHSMGLAT